MKISHLLLAAGIIVRAACAENIAGEWHGAIEVPDDAPLRLALHVVRSGSAELKATLDSIDEGGMDLPVDSITVIDSTVQFQMAGIGGAFEGRLAKDGSRIVGSWSQDHEQWPLTWFSGEDPGNSWKLYDRQQALENGRVYTGWFLKDRISDLWQVLSPVMQQAMGSVAKLRDFRVQEIQNLGLERQVLDESVMPEGALQVYRRLAQFEKVAGYVTVAVAFNSRGNVALFEIRPMGAILE